jgi:ribosomal protein S18 acetylase RimI-like enzyme
MKIYEHQDDLGARSAQYMILLKKASEQDIPLLMELEKSVSGTNVYSPMLTEDDWKEEFCTNDIFLIENDGVIIGNCSYEKKSDSNVYLSGLMIVPAYQGKGFGRRALSQILSGLTWAKRIDLVTHPENKWALSLYKSFGFEVEDRKEDYFGDGEPRLIMALNK